MKIWKVYRSNVYGTIIHTDNGGKYGSGYLEAQVSKIALNRYRVEITTGFSFIKTTYTDSLEAAKEIGMSLISKESI